MARHTQYKQQNIKIWNELAPRYHRKWIDSSIGAWKSSQRLIKLVNIKKGHKVLDVACGTGAVTKKIAQKIGKTGHVVGIDTSIKAISIAKKINGQNVHFVNGDAESFHFKERFDVITCQYALFFFPNSKKALQNMAKNLKADGVLGITVHGNNTPYYTSIIDVIEQFIPDYLPTGAVKLDRFGDSTRLKKEIKDAGFKKIATEELVFSYSPGTFNEYWQNYLRYLSKPTREKLYSLSKADRLEIRRKIKEKTTPYTKKNGKIVFPWQVLISTANP